MSTLSAHLRRLALVAVLLPSVASAQSLDARRMAMGGVAVGGTGNSGNIAYVAVPEAKGFEQGHSLALPLGMIQFLADLPELNPDNPNFNAFELANLLYNPPWNLQLIQPPAPSGDITITIAKNSLAVDMEELKDIFPREGTEFGGVASGAGVSYGVGHFSFGLGPLFHDHNDLILNGPLHDALADGKPFVPNTSYLMHDDARGQSAIALQAGYAQRLLGLGDPHEPGGWGIYAGGRAKMLRGLAYGDLGRALHPHGL